MRPLRNIEDFVKQVQGQIETVQGGYGILSESDLIGVDVFGENQPKSEPIPIPDTRTKEEKDFAFRVKFNPEIQQTKAYLEWMEQKRKSKG